ncbi:hypothetical protein E2562_029558 [Oryza meyeriana var. granulata]|uniref:Uncharacterized protein n=1 Tax=Oryza meyeriana var. granulata TaxID=110450 RepID=A0A6G1C8Q5_9ORYZ|nr:hypothetical protein E2562_029558 [Oryza meyeriana var. granulata]
MLITVHILIVISCPELFTAIALVDVSILHLCRYLLHHGVSVISGAGIRLRFRLRTADAIIYMALSVLLFLRFAPVMSWWGALAAWVTILLIVEAVLAFFFFFFPYGCCNERPEGDVHNPHV